MPLNAEEEFQLEWIKNHQMEDKDELAEIQAEAEASKTATCHTRQENAPQSRRLGTSEPRR